MWPYWLNDGSDIWQWHISWWIFIMMFIVFVLFTLGLRCLCTVYHRFFCNSVYYSVLLVTISVFWIAFGCFVKRFCVFLLNFSPFLTMDYYHWRRRRAIAAYLLLKRLQNRKYRRFGTCEIFGCEIVQLWSSYPSRVNVMPHSLHSRWY